MAPQFGSLVKSVNTLCFPPAFFEEGFAGGWAEGGIAGGGIATSARDTSVELEFNPSTLAIPLVARGRPQPVSASSRPELRSGVRLLAFLGPPRQWLSVLHSMFLPVLMRYDG